MQRNKIGEFIQTVRKEKNLTQKELGEQIGVSDKTVSKWETGAGIPDTDILKPLCEALDISVNELLSGEKLQIDDYSKRAEENMLNLLKEKEAVSKEALFPLILGGIFAVIAFVFLIFPVMLPTSDILPAFFDGVTMFALLLTCLAIVLLSGSKTKKSVISVLKKSVLPAGSFIAFFEAVLVMGFFSKSDALGPNLAVVFLAPVYALLIHLVLIPIDERLQKH